MPSSQVEVYNLALSHIQSKSFVQSLTEDSIERKTCDVHFQNSMDVVLEDHDWGFASKYETLAVLKESTDTVPPPLPWLFEYQYPANCLKVREIQRSTDSEKEIAFAIGLNDNNTGRVIHTDKSTAVARFTRRITNPNIFSPKAIVAVSFKLATRIEPSLVGDLKIKNDLEKHYLNSIASAQSSNFNEGVNRDEAEPELIASRT